MSSSPFESARLYPRAAPVAVSDQEDEGTVSGQRQGRRLSTGSSQPSFGNDSQSEVRGAVRMDSLMDSAYQLSPTCKKAPSLSADSDEPVRSEQGTWQGTGGRPQQGKAAQQGARPEAHMLDSPTDDVKENCGVLSPRQHTDRPPLSPSNRVQGADAPQAQELPIKQSQSESSGGSADGQQKVHAREHEAVRWLAQKSMSKSEGRYSPTLAASLRPSFYLCPHSRSRTIRNS